MGHGKNYESRRFFCINCGHEGIPLQRTTDKLKSKFHRKALYCPWCKSTVNHIECRTQSDIDEFKINFENGIYKEEAINSINFIQENWIEKRI